MPVNKKFRKKVRTALNNEHLRNALGNFARSYPEARQQAYKGIDFQHLRDEIRQVKADAIDHFEELADRFEEKVRQRGGQVYRAADGAEVARIVKEIAARRNARLCVKSKSMATEEIHLNQRLEDVLDVVETDLGEWIIQQIDQRPSHMVMPAIHLSRETCAEIFSRVTGEDMEPDIPQMVKKARQILRAEFLAADIGITGCNIAAADTGTMVLFTNEGNARLTSTLPSVHIVLLGYEKLVARFLDISPLAEAIPRSATCQSITSYVTMISAPSQAFKGPDEDEIVEKQLHVILLDNGRKEMLQDPDFKEIGHCIRCASCLNVCPVYELVGGQVWGEVYSGGIGSLLTAFLGSPQSAEKIQELCLACGKCLEYCPSKIDIPGQILKVRARVRQKAPPPFFQRMAIEKVLPRKKLLDFSLKAVSPASKFIRTLPKLAPKTFRSLFPAIDQLAAVPKSRGTAAFFYGCLIDYVYPEIGEAVINLMNRAAYRVIVPEQKCCGAPGLYSGLKKNAARMAKENLELWGKRVDSFDHIITACPTCTVLLKKQWPRLLKDDPAASAIAEKVAAKAMDFIQLFSRLQEDTPFIENLHYVKRQRPATVTYHYSCHLRWELGIRDEPRHVLSALPGVEWVEMEDADRCCGFGGTYSVKLPEISAELLKRKIENIKKSGASHVLVDCPGCLLSLKTGLERETSRIRAHHSAVFMAQRCK
jgi:iron-sulfur cluster protein